MSTWPKTVFIYTDGACRGNPGPCSLGLTVINKHQDLIYEEARYLSKKNTNNFAEYKAVIRALELCVQHQIQKLYLFSDSQLLIQQLQNKYKVKSPNIKSLFEECKKLLSQIPQYHLEHISREKNQSADALANKALDENRNS